MKKDYNHLRRIARYIVQHYGPAKSWHRGSLLMWLDWALCEGFVMLARDGEEIIGLMIARPVMDGAHSRFSECGFDPEGKCIFVDLVIRTHPQALACLLFAGLRRFGTRPEVGWNNLKHDRITITSTERLKRAILRKELYGR